MSIKEIVATLPSQILFIANGVPVKIATGNPLEVGFVYRKSDDELLGSLHINLSFDSPLHIQFEE